MCCYRVFFLILFFPSLVQEINEGEENRYKEMNIKAVVVFKKIHEKERKILHFKK